MRYRSNVLNQQIWEVEMDLLSDLKENLRQQLTKAGIVSKSDNPIYDYFNFKKRFIEPKPRRVLKSHEFKCPDAYSPALQEIIDKITSGTNLFPYLSKEIRNAEYNDALLND